MPDSSKLYQFVNKHPVVLIAPLDWGLGHATRCIPLITHLLTIGCEVIIASEGTQNSLLEEEFRTVRHVKLRGYRLRYGKNRWQTISLILLQIPKILIAITREARWLTSFLAKNRVDIIISDNRFGFLSANVPSVFITHQLTIKTPFGTFLGAALQRINYRFIQKFSECWVPDYHGHTNLAGELSHPVKMPLIPVKYLGRLSRFSQHESVSSGDVLLILLSGPEPQRSIFEEIVVSQLKINNHHAVLVRGLPGEQKTPEWGYENLVIHNHLSSDRLNKLMAISRIIISRSGYSTVMDIIGRNRKCIFVPTPGQPEQEYLARYLEEKKLCIQYQQNEFLLERALEDAERLPTICLNNPEDLYKKVIEDFIMEKISKLAN